MADTYTNASLKHAIDTYGDRIKSILFDDGYKVMIGYPGSEIQHVNELILDSFGGCDVVGIRTKIKSYADAKRAGASFVTYHTTACIFAITIMDEGFEDFCPDPHGIR